MTPAGSVGPCRSKWAGWYGGVSSSDGGFQCLCLQELETLATSASVAYRATVRWAGAEGRVDPSGRWAKFEKGIGKWFIKFWRAEI
jgi:hypothetical protein